MGIFGFQAPDEKNEGILKVGKRFAFLIGNKVSYTER